MSTGNPISIWQSLQYALPLFTVLDLQALHHIDFPSFLLRSERNWSRTHCEKFGFLAAKSQDVGSRVMSFCLISLGNCSIHIYMSQESPWAIPRKLVVWLLCHGGGGDKELGGGHSLRGPRGGSAAKIQSEVV